MRKIIYVTILILLLSGMQTIQATEVDVNVYSDEDITGYINAISNNGSVYYYIDGIEVYSEFNNLWEKIGIITGDLSLAISIAYDAYYQSKENQEDIYLIQQDVANNSYKIYVLEDELIAFENEYKEFKFETSNTLAEHNYKLHNLEWQINKLEVDLTEKIDFNLMLIQILALSIAISIFLIVLFLYYHIKKTNKRFVKKVNKKVKQSTLLVIINVILMIIIVISA